MSPGNQILSFYSIHPIRRREKLKYTIYDLNLADAFIVGFIGTGGLAGVNYGTISNCSVTGEVIGNDHSTGGLVDHVVAGGPTIPGELFEVRECRQTRNWNRDLRQLETWRLLQESFHGDGGR